MSGTLAGALVGIAVASDAFAGDLEGGLVAVEERVRIKEAAKAVLRRMRLTVALGRPLKFPLAMKAASIGELDPRDAIRLRTLVDSGILKTVASPDVPGYIVIEPAQRSVEYDPGTGIFRSVGRKLVQLIEARYGSEAGACSCLVTSVPDWPDGSAPFWVEQIAASRAFPEFDGPTMREHMLFFTQRGGDWTMSAAPVLSESLYRGVAP